VQCQHSHEVKTAETTRLQSTWPVLVIQRSPVSMTGALVAAQLDTNSSVRRSDEELLVVELLVLVLVQCLEHRRCLCPREAHVLQGVIQEVALGDLVGRDGV